MNTLVIGRSVCAALIVLACLAFTASAVHAELYWDENNMRNVWVVRKGEDLSKIAQAAGQDLGLIMKWNPGKGDLIYPGEKVFCSAPPNVAAVVWGRVSALFAERKAEVDGRLAENEARVEGIEDRLRQEESQTGRILDYLSGFEQRAGQTNERLEKTAEAVGVQSARIDKMEREVGSFREGLTSLEQRTDKLVRATILGALCIVVLLLLSLIAVYGVWLYRRSRTVFQVKDWEYRPQVDWLGRFIVLQNNKQGKLMRYRERGAARDSIKNSLNKDGELVTREIAAGRLWESKGQTPNSSKSRLQVVRQS